MRAAPRSISLLAASFFGFPCQGIHRAPLVSSRLKSHVIVYMSKSKTRLRIPYGYAYLVFDEKSCIIAIDLRIKSLLASLCGCQGAPRV